MKMNIPKYIPKIMKTAQQIRQAYWDAREYVGYEHLRDNYQKARESGDVKLQEKLLRKDGELLGRAKALEWVLGEPDVFFEIRTRNK